jgi:hypothetical protein
MGADVPLGAVQPEGNVTPGLLLLL